LRVAGWQVIGEWNPRTADGEAGEVLGNGCYAESALIAKAGVDMHFVNPDFLSKAISSADWGLDSYRTAGYIPFYYFFDSAEAHTCARR
jgi:hypothetical protein